MFIYSSTAMVLLSPFVCLVLLSSSPLVPLTCRPNPACSWPGPKLCPLSLLSHHSSFLPRCRLHPFAAHGKSQHRVGKLQPRWDKQLCHSWTRLHLKYWRRRLVWVRSLCGRSLPHPAILPLSGGVTLQQVRTSSATWRQPAAFAFYRLHTERPKVGWNVCVGLSVS